MTEKDKQLIKEAEQTHYADWTHVSDLIEQAESQETIKRLRDIKSWYVFIEKIESDAIDRNPDWENRFF